ncbi:MAG: RNA polymerase sigma factor [Bacteroidota bacterium]
MYYSIKHPLQDQLKEANKLLKDLALKLTGNKHDANDLFQDTALRIIKNSDKFAPESNFRAWSVTIMRNIFINNYRKKVRRNLFYDRTLDGYYLNNGSELESNLGESNLAVEELKIMIDELPTDFKEAFMLRYQGYKYEEIAAELETPLGTVKSRIFFAKKKLKKKYQSLHGKR